MTKHKKRKSCRPLDTPRLNLTTLYQEQAVCGKMKMDPAKRAQTQNAGEVLSL